MKLFFFLWIGVLQQYYSNATFLGIHIGPECISLSQLNHITEILCKQKDNKALWKKAIDCHKPITEEFMRASGEAQCIIPKYVQDPNNTMYSIEDVFFNVCGLVEGSYWDLLQSGVCLMFGKSNVMSHSVELAAVKKNWGDNVPCNIGKCFLGLDI